METKVIKEQPIFAVRKPYAYEDLEIYAADLKSAEVGDKWETENQDRYPNRRCTWQESFTIVYKDECDVAVLYHCTPGYDGCECYQEEKEALIWVTLH